MLNNGKGNRDVASGGLQLSYKEASKPCLEAAHFFVHSGFGALQALHPLPHFDAENLVDGGGSTSCLSRYAPEFSFICRIAGGNFDTLTK